MFLQVLFSRSPAILICSTTRSFRLGSAVPTSNFDAPIHIHSCF
uniref:Uncharacterized protein n=1 Tax=Arundo donax TaxID=35708 RepID=A0A0A8YG46_ARUDO